MNFNLFGLRHYKKSALPRIIINRFIHISGYHFCHCNRFIKLDDCYGVINNDCMMCWDCCDQ